MHGSPLTANRLLNFSHTCVNVCAAAWDMTQLRSKIQLFFFLFGNFWGHLFQVKKWFLGWWLHSMSRNVSGQTGKGAEPCTMKIALAERGGEVTVCLSRRLISTHTHTHTHPGDKHRSDSGRILFPFYQEAVPDKGAVCVCLLSKAQVIPQMKTNIKWCSKLEILFPPYLNPLNSPGPQSN